MNTPSIETPSAEPLSPAGPRKNQVWKEIVELGQSLILGVVLAMVLQIFIQPTIVYGQSMEPNLHDQERVILDKVAYHIGTPARGDIVVFPVKGEPLPLIKRVIGLPGETVEVRGGRVLVNGVVLREPYASGPTVGNMAAVRVPANAVFVMGDNRGPGRSLDSRRLGPISLDKLVGRARLAYWPLTDAGILSTSGLK
jgi:signal peptidase I